MGSSVGNIGARGCKRRRIGGYFWTIVSVVALIVMIVMRSPRPMLLLLVIPIALAALGFFQVQEQTCVIHAVLGTRENDDGVVKLDAADRDDVRRRAWRVAAQSIIAALFATSVIYYFARYR